MSTGREIVRTMAHNHVSHAHNLVSSSQSRLKTRRDETRRDEIVSKRRDCEREQTPSLENSSVPGLPKRLSSTYPSGCWPIRASCATAGNARPPSGMRGPGWRWKRVVASTPTRKRNINLDVTPCNQKKIDM